MVVGGVVVVVVGGDDDDDDDDDDNDDDDDIDVAVVVRPDCISPACKLCKMNPSPPKNPPAKLFT